MAAIGTSAYCFAATAIPAPNPASAHGHSFGLPRAISAAQSASANPRVTIDSAPIFE
jgi:hypothetical protein